MARRITIENKEHEEKYLSVTEDRLNVNAELTNDETKSIVRIDELGALKTFELTRLVGTGFNGTVKDTNFWTETLAGSGAVTQADGEVELATGTDANSTVKYQSVRKARKLGGVVNLFRAMARLATVHVVDNIRRIGAYDANNGYFIQIDGSTLSVGARKATVDTLVESGSFNGNLGASFTPDMTIMILGIAIAERGVNFYINDVLLHKIVGGTTPLTEEDTLPVTMENINYNDNTVDSIYHVRFATILRNGGLLTAPTSFYLPLERPQLT